MSLNYAVRENLVSSPLRRLVIHRLEVNPLHFMSPIERWSDENYTPQPLSYTLHRSATTTEIIAPLHGFASEDVRVDLHGERVIILLSRADDTPLARCAEYYCEITLPANVNANAADVEITSELLIVRLAHRSLRTTGLKNAINRALEQLLPFANGWRLGRLDDEE
jgi:HSP20 family molecular chaperone IbpA